MVLVFFLLTFILFNLYQLMPANRAYTEARTEIQSMKKLTAEEKETKFDELYLKYRRRFGTDTDNNIVLYLRWLGLFPISSARYQIVRDFDASMAFINQTGGFPVDVKTSDSMFPFKTLHNEQELTDFLASEEYQASRALLATEKESNVRMKNLYILEETNSKPVFAGIFQGEFGFSYEHMQPVVEVVPVHMRNSFLIGLISEIAVLGVTIPLGIKCAVKKNSRFDRFTQFFTLIGFSTPSFIIYIVFIVFFCSILGLFPVSGMKTPGANYTGWREVLDVLHHVTLPTICLTFGSLASITRIARASMIDALNLDCIRTARAKGLSERKVIYHHAFRNTLIPLVTIVGGSLPGLFSGALITETLYMIPGIGYTSYNAMVGGDIPFSMFYLVFLAILTLAGNLISDILYAVVDPRVRIA
jgi:peptide/nickel transport system permease protein